VLSTVDVPLLPGSRPHSLAAISHQLPSLLTASCKQKHLFSHVPNGNQTLSKTVHYLNGVAIGDCDFSNILIRLKWMLMMEWTYLVLNWYKGLSLMLAARLVTPCSCCSLYNTFLLMLRTKLITTCKRVYPSERYVPFSSWRCLVFSSVNEVRETVSVHLIWIQISQNSTEDKHIRVRPSTVHGFRNFHIMICT
jgi:hypothetical protein